MANTLIHQGEALMNKLARGLGIFAVTLLATAGCAKDLSAPRTAASDPEGYKSFLRARTEDELKKKLRDPDSAVFSDVHFGKLVADGKEAVVVCGRVNSRNGFGGMTGAQRFIGGGEASAIEGRGPLCS